MLVFNPTDDPASDEVARLAHGMELLTALCAAERCTQRVCVQGEGCNLAQEFLRGPPQHGNGWAADFAQQQDGQQRWLAHPGMPGPPASWHATAPPPAWLGGRQSGPQMHQRPDGASTSTAAWGEEVCEPKCCLQPPGLHFLAVLQSG